METELKAEYTTQKSFYGKAVVIRDGMVDKLKSYKTIVAEYNHQTNELKVHGWYSRTTAMHINEFAQQLGFDKMTKAEMLE